MFGIGKKIGFKLKGATTQGGISKKKQTSPYNKFLNASYFKITSITHKGQLNFYPTKR